jgi:hypothetical protein
MSETQVKRETSLAKVGYKTGCLKATEPIAHGRAHDMRDAPQVPLPSVGQRRWGVYTWAYRLYSSILYRAGPSGDRTGPAFLRCIMQYASVSSPSLKGGVSTTARLPSDEYGDLLDVVTAVEVGELIQLEGPTDLDDDELRATTSFSWYRWFPAAVVVDGELFFHRGRRRYVGILCWDSAAMDRSEVVRLLNHLHKLDGWMCLSAETSLFATWEKGEITAADLERAIGG